MERAQPLRRALERREARVADRGRGVLFRDLRLRQLRFALELVEERERQRQAQRPRIRIVAAPQGETGAGSVPTPRIARGDRGEKIRPHPAPRRPRRVERHPALPHRRTLRGELADRLVVEREPGGREGIGGRGRDGIVRADRAGEGSVRQLERIARLDQGEPGVAPLDLRAA